METGGNGNQIDRWYIDFLSTFYSSWLEYNRILADYKEGGKPLFPAIDRLSNEHLFRLKETAHHLFRENVQHKTGEISSTIALDLIIGSLFHEMLRLKESAYMVEQYRPKIAALGEVGQHQEGDFLEYGQRMLKNSNRQMKQGFAEIEALYRLASRSLHATLRDHADPRLVLRFLLRHRKLLCEVYGKRVDEIYRRFYPGAWAEVLMRGVEDYADTGHLAEALHYAELLHQELVRGAAAVDGCPPALRARLFAKLMAIGKVSHFTRRAEDLTHKLESLFSKLAGPQPATLEKTR
ncbi:hypothetical protein HS125_09575 [bacterium]|nr:hypothetical protein [bacterium]